ncbi:MAG: DinB family protein [Acidimicrobiales bacterium]
MKFAISALLEEITTPKRTVPLLERGHGEKELIPCAGLSSADRPLNSRVSWSPGVVQRVNNVVMEYSLESGTAVLKRTPGALESILRNLPDVWAMSDEGPGIWSPYQVVGHMAHLEDVDWLDRTRVILEIDGPHSFRPIDREAGFSRFDGWTMGELLDRFTVKREENIVELEELVGQGDLEREGRHPDFGSVTLRQLLATWVVHDLNHLSQIVKTMAKQYRDAVGPWREYLPIIDAE